MNDMHLEVFYLNHGQEVNLVVFSYFYVVFGFLFIIGAGAGDTLKNVTDNHCSTLYVVNSEFFENIFMFCFYLIKL